MRGLNGINQIQYIYNLLLSGLISYTYNPANRKLSPMSCTGADGVIFIDKQYHPYIV